MHQPPRRLLLKTAALAFALGATGCYVWKAQEKPTRKHVPGTKSIDSLVTAPQQTRVPGTKNIMQPVSGGLKFGEENRRIPETVFPPPIPEKTAR